MGRYADRPIYITQKSILCLIIRSKINIRLYTVFEITIQG